MSSLLLLFHFRESLRVVVLYFSFWQGAVVPFSLAMGITYAFFYWTGIPFFIYLIMAFFRLMDL